jgi:hypothetical protein
MFDDVDGIVYNPHPPSQSFLIHNQSATIVNRAMPRFISRPPPPRPRLWPSVAEAFHHALPHQQIDRSAL